MIAPRKSDLRHEVRSRCLHCGAIARENGMVFHLFHAKDDPIVIQREQRWTSDWEPMPHIS